MLLESEEEMKDQIVAIYGGRVAEEIIFGNVTTGAFDDLQKAQKIAHALVFRLGFSSKIGPVALSENEYGVKQYSDNTNSVVDREIKKILSECKSICTQLVITHRCKIEKLAELLMEKEILGIEELKSILGERGFEISEGMKIYIESKI